MFIFKKVTSNVKMILFRVIVFLSVGLLLIHCKTVFCIKRQ